MSNWRKVRLDLGEVDPNPAPATGSFCGYIGPPTSTPIATAAPELEPVKLNGCGITPDFFKPIPGVVIGE